MTSTTTLRWDTCDIARAHADFLRQQDPNLNEDDAISAAYADSFIYDDAWRQLLDDLDAVLDDMAPDRTFYAQATNLGWRHLSGEKIFHASDARDFLKQLLPDTDCTFTITCDGATIQIRNAHHDAPTGEFYTVTPVPDHTAEAA